MNEPQAVQISLAEVAAALGPEQLILRLVALQRRVAELEAQVAHLQGEVQAADTVLERLAGDPPAPYEGDEPPEGRVVTPDEIVAQLNGR